MAKGIFDGFYTNEVLIKMKDKNGNVPEIFINCSRGRSAGKTFSAAKMLYEWRFKDDFPLLPLLDPSCDKFVLLTRHKKELGSVAEGIMKGYLEFSHPDVSVYEKIQMKGTFSNIYAEYGAGENRVTKHIGYVIPLAADDEIKKISSMFVDAWGIFFDEFQPMNNSTYLKNEVDRLLSIHTSLARGGGHSVRYFPIFMSSNTINIFNPYFIALGMHGKIQSNTRYYRGDGFVFERCMVSGLSAKHASSGVNKAFAGRDIIDYADDDSWLNDDQSCIDKPNGWGRPDYVCTLVSGKTRYAVKYYSEVGLYYIDYNVDQTSKYVYNITLDGNLNIPFIKTSPVLDNIRKRFMNGLVRMKDNNIKSVVLDLFV